LLNNENREMLFLFRASLSWSWYDVC